KVRSLDGWHRIFGAAPTLEDIAAFDLCPFKIAGFAGYAYLPLRARVVGLQFVVCKAPILNRVVLGQFFRAVLFDGFRIELETVRLEAREYPTPMLTRATDAGAGNEST